MNKSREVRYFQDQLEGNHCFGCGPKNGDGLQIKSYWGNDQEAFCEFKPKLHHCAAPTGFLNGGVMATLIDCHCICTAIAHAYRKNGHDIGQGPTRWYATAKLDVSYLRPTPIDATIIVKARIVGESEKTTDISCTLEANDRECAKANVVAAAVPESWMSTYKA